jgi:hypothetical protein
VVGQEDVVARPAVEHVVAAGALQPVDAGSTVERVGLIGAVDGVVAVGQARGDIRSDIPPMAALDLLAGPLLARAFAGEDTGPRWRKQAFETWWSLVRTPRRNSP